MNTGIRFLAFVMGVFVCFTFGFSWRDIQKGDLPPAEAFVGLVKGSSMPKTAEGVFKQAYDNIHQGYIRPINARGLKYAGIQGMMGSLGDPHTVFLPPRDAKEFDVETKANFGGVGARLAPDPMGARITSVFEGGPAEKAGMKPGDLVTAVNDKSVLGWNIEAIAEIVKGEIGTQVRLQAVRAGHAKALQFTIERARIVTPTVSSQYLEEQQIGHLTIEIMSAVTAEQFDDELRKLEKNPLKGLVIDLRNNPGGLLDTAVDLLSRFVEDKTVVKMKMRDGRESIERTDSGLVHRFGYPVVVLMNEDTASAAEIFAGALRDYRLTTLIGTHSYGKAAVQNVFPLVDGASAKITMAKYYLPLGDDLTRKVDEEGAYIGGGLEPDIKVELPLDSMVTIGDPKTDTQLARAIEVIKSKG